MTKPTRTLIVDDDEGIRFFLQEILEAEGHAITLVSSGEEALDRLREQAFDLAFLDLRLGGRVDGLRVLEAISWRWPQMARIILTGHGTLDSAMTAIREGVDAYLLKPVRAAEVRQTVGEVLSKRESSDRQEIKQAPTEGHILQQGPFVVNLLDRHAFCHDEPLDLSVCEFELLVHLMQNAHRVVPPPELVEVVRNYECDHLQEARDVIKWYIYQLRRKVEANPSRPRHILNVRGVGYTFKA
jgi:DNA-binding response OmpR family regulator